MSNNKPLITGSVNAKGKRLLPSGPADGSGKETARRWTNNGTDADSGLEGFAADGSVRGPVKYTGVRARVQTRQGLTIPVSVTAGITPEYLDQIEGISYKPLTYAVWPADGSKYVSEYRITGNIDAVLEFARPRGISTKLVAASPEEFFALAELEGFTARRADLDAKRITPRSLIGTGYKNPRKEAERYVDAEIARCIRVIEGEVE
jgi:hypothetical protein